MFSYSIKVWPPLLMRIRKVIKHDLKAGNPYSWKLFGQFFFEVQSWDPCSWWTSPRKVIFCYSIKVWPPCWCASERWIKMVSRLETLTAESCLGNSFLKFRAGTHADGRPWSVCPQRVHIQPDLVQNTCFSSVSWEVLEKWCFLFRLRSDPPADAHQKGE